MQFGDLVVDTTKSYRSTKIEKSVGDCTTIEHAHALHCDLEPEAYSVDCRSKRSTLFQFDPQCLLFALMRDVAIMPSCVCQRADVRRIRMPIMDHGTKTVL